MGNYNYLGEKLLWKKKEGNEELQKRQDVMNFGIANVAEYSETIKQKAKYLNDFADQLSESGGSLVVQEAVKEIAELLEAQLRLNEKATPFFKVTTQEVAGPDEDDDEDEEDKGEAWKKASGYENPYSDKEEVQMFTVPKMELRFKNDEKEIESMRKTWNDSEKRIKEIMVELESKYPIDYLKISSFLETENRTN